MRFVAAVALVLGSVYAVRHWAIASFRVSTASMQAALEEGDCILVQKRLDLFPPKQNGVFLFRSPLLRDSADCPLFLSRAVGMPGDTIRISAEGYRINGKAYPRSPQALSTYFVAFSLKEVFFRQLEKLQIPLRDVRHEAFGLTLSLTAFEEYQLRDCLSSEQNSRFVNQQIRPYELIVPRRDRPYRLDANALVACREAILRETGGKAVIRDGKLYLDGKETAFFFFRENYYWLLADNQKAAVDSRHLGFVPESYLVGSVFFRWYAKELRRCFQPIK